MKHKHYDCIIAWANGEIIELLNAEMEQWEIIEQPGWYENKNYRIKPKWIGLREDEIKHIMDCWRGGYIDIKKVEQLLKDKNT